MYTYAAGSPGTFHGMGNLGAMSWANAIAPARLQEANAALAMVQEKAPAALPLLYQAVTLAQQAVSSADATSLLKQAEVAYRGAAVTAARAGVKLPELKHFPPPKKAEDASSPVNTARHLPGVPPRIAEGRDWSVRVAEFAQRKYGPYQTWEWALGAGGIVLGISLALKVAKYALIGGAVAGGALVAGKFIPGLIEGKWAS
jgi:hypothetical protein